MAPSGTGPGTGGWSDTRAVSFDRRVEHLRAGEERAPAYPPAARCPSGARSPCGSIGDHRARRGPHDDRRDHMHRTHDPAFWSGRRVLVTGHTGFKGAWLTCWLRDLGAEVYGVSLPASAHEHAALGRSWPLDGRPGRARRRRRDRVARRRRGVPARGGAPPRGAVAGQRGLPRPGRARSSTNVHGHRARAASSVERLPERARGARRDHRQGLRRPPADAVPRGRLPRRQGPLLGEQGVRRARHALVAAPRRPRGHRAGRQRDRRRRLRAQPHRP